jgi:hypothetical protein
MGRSRPIRLPCCPCQSAVCVKYSSTQVDAQAPVSIYGMTPAMLDDTRRLYGSAIGFNVVACARLQLR